MATATDGIALYVHMPWCLSKCPYCDFNSHTLGPRASLDQYAAALEQEIEIDAPLAGERPVVSVFIGGGTPSLFSPQHIGAVLGAVVRHLRVADDVEVTMEANPGALEHGRLQDYRSAGVNRLSLGAQSFDAGALQKLGRIHGPSDIVSAYEEARRAGFDNINLDLMFALPGQTEQQARADLEKALDLGPEHLSYYELTLEPNTVFHAKPPQDIPDEESAGRIQEAALSRLSAAGFGRYEVSAFARDGAECRHNLNYWRFGDYLGVGAGAHAKWVDADGLSWRSRKAAHPASYLAGGDAVRWRLSGADLVFEFALNALRLTGGFTAERFEARTGVDFTALREPLEAARADGLVERSDAGRWRASELGFRFLNDLQARFLSANDEIGADHSVAG